MQLKEQLLALLFSIPMPYELRRILFRILRPIKYREWQDKRRASTNKTYSIKSFDEYKCIFIHIPKCAGISISKSLFGELVGHITARQYQLIFNQLEFESYFKFTFVRNPWDRLVSAYHFLIEGGYNESNKRWAEANLVKYPDFEAFVKNWVNRKNIFSQQHFIPQYQHLCIRNNIPAVNFIGYFENLEDDYSHVQKQIGSSTNMVASNKGRTRVKDYRDYYNEETMKIVYDVYHEDIQILGYNFDGSSLEEQLKQRLT